MARPQQPEHARSDTTNVDPDPVEPGRLEQPPPSTGGEGGPIPVDNQPGHHPAKEQDKPDLDAFAAKLGATKATPTKAATSKASGPKATTKAAPANGTSSTASRPAATPERGPAPPPKIQATPANRPAAAPGWPESAPAADDLGPLPDPAGDQGPEPRVVSLVLLPLRETVKRLEQLDRTLTERLSERVRSGRSRPASRQ